MRRYIPSIPSMSFGNSASSDPSAEPPANPDSASPTKHPTPSDSDPAALPSPDSSNHRSSYRPNVPALPAVRKYLFAGASNLAHLNHHPAHELRRRLSGGASHHGAAPSSPRHADHPAHRSLPELSTMVDRMFGPIGKPSQTIVKHFGRDRLIDTLHAGKQERERLLLQFLRARQHDAHDAFAMLKDATQWRTSINIGNFLSHSKSNLIAPGACFPMHIISTPAECKQPVVYGLIRLLDKKKAERVPFQNALLSFLESVYFEETYISEEMVIILDFRDWSIRRNAPYRLVKDGIQTLQDYYPERLGRVFLVNYPTSIRAAYTAISPIIDAGAKEKIVWVADADPSATLQKYVSPKSIPSFLGGELQATFPPTWPDVAAEFGAGNTGGGRLKA